MAIVITALPGPGNTYLRERLAPLGMMGDGLITSRYYSALCDVRGVLGGALIWAANIIAEITSRTTIHRVKKKKVTKTSTRKHLLQCCCHWRKSYKAILTKHNKNTTWK